MRRRHFGRPAPKLQAGIALFESITERLRQRWSPQQIAAHLAKLHPHEASQRASHETIYNGIYAQLRGELKCELKCELVACLRMALAKRWPCSRGQDRCGEIAHLLSIHVRPPEVQSLQFPGHWEGDLIKGAGNASAVGTLVERSTRLLMLVKLPHPRPRYLPKGTDLSGYTQEQLDAIADETNGRPRKTLGWA